MNTYWLGIALLVTLFSVGPAVRRFVLMRTVRDLAIPGAVVLPRFWRASLVQYRRSKWDADVSFAAPGELTGGGQHGHLQMVAQLRRPTPSVEVHLRGHGSAEPGAPTTGDPRFDQAFALRGDPAFAALLFGPEVRDLVLRVHGLGGRLAAVRDGRVDLSGPLSGGATGIRQFLGTCELLLDLMAAAVSTLPEKV